MAGWTELLQAGVDSVTWRQALLSLVVAYLLSQSIAAVYAWSHQGLSYSRNFVLALVGAGVVAAMLMLAIGNSLARGIGIVGTLALIRFRTNLRDPLDMLFVFASFGAGIAAGTGNMATGAIGTGMFLVVMRVLTWTGFGSHRSYDGVVRLKLAHDPEAERQLEQVLRSMCRRFTLITLREVRQGEEMERAYQITLKEPDDEARLVSALAALPGARGVTLSMQEATVEL